jgi:hypothetical protein
MDLLLDFGDSNISADRAIEQLNRFGLYPQLLQEIAIDDLVEQMAMALSIASIARLLSYRYAEG